MATDEAGREHEHVPSRSVRMSNAGTDGGQTATAIGKLEKTTSLQMMEGHEVNDHLLKELWYARSLPIYLNVA